jgi:DNA primase
VRLSQSRKNWLERVTAAYQQARPEWVDSYLIDRGIAKEAADTYRLGYVNEPDPQHEQFQGRLSVPFLTPTGVVALRFRCLLAHDHDGCPKYQGPEGEETRLYNVDALHRAESYVGIAEGELDALVATESGVPTVGVPGSHAWKDHWFRLFEDFDRVLVFGDGDKAGREFGSKMLSILPNAETRTMPNGEDIGSFVIKYGWDEFINHAFG